jgi:hypothetical protein
MRDPVPASGIGRSPEYRSLFLDALTLADLQRIVAQRMAYYNGRRRFAERTV